MDIVFSFIICFVFLVVSVFKGIFVGYPLTVGLIIFIILSLKQGYGLKNVLYMAYKGGKKSFIVLQIFILIGGITAVWIASGTVPAIVYYGIKFLNPKLFILSAFIISSFVSFLIGTSFGTVGTVGIALMVMARGGGVNTALVAGAILSGAYFGDRCSPMSSSANLVATLTDTDIYVNIKNMFKTSIIPFMLAVIMYSIFSLKTPLSSAGNGIVDEITNFFNINLLTLIPAIIILFFSLFKISVKKLMLMSIIAASIISVVLQHNTIVLTIKYIIFGYKLDSATSLSTIIKGGGILSMLKIAIVVFVSSAFTGIFEGTGMLKLIENSVKRANTKFSLFFTTIVISIATSAFGCTQALAVILTHLLTNKAYVDNGIDKYELAADLENTAIVIAPLIPWNIAVLVPLITLGEGYGAIVYCFYLYLIPIVNLVCKVKY